MYAAQNNVNVMVVSLLLNAGAKINDRTASGVTALMYAARSNRNPEVISILLKAGANGRLKSDEGKTAFDYAAENESLKGTSQYQELDRARF